MSKTIGVVIGVIAVAAVIAVAVSMEGEGLEVTTARVERGALRVAVVEDGQTRARRRYAVAAPIGGRLARIGLQVGDPVEVASVVARIFPSPESPRQLQAARARVAAAQARRSEASVRLQEVRTRIAQLEREVERGRSLVDAGVSTRGALERDELALTAARQQLRAGRAAAQALNAEVDAARAALIGAGEVDEAEAVPVLSPAAGRVLRVFEESARIIAPGTPLLEVGDPGELEVVVDVLSEDAVKIAPGAAVFIEGWGGEATLEGRVRLVEPEAFTKVSTLGVEEQRVNVLVDLTAPPPSLGLGYRLEAHVVTWAGEGVLIAPTSALFRRGEVWHVFTIEAGRAALREVKLGHRTTTGAEVLGGLGEGDAVILFPPEELEEGALVKASP